MAIFQVQKLLNNKFNAWRTQTSDSIDVPYGWSGSDGFGVANFDVTLVSGLSITQGVEELFSHPCVIYNNATHVYTLSCDMKYDNATATNANIYVREFDESGTGLANYNWLPSLTASYVTNELTIGGIGSGATLILDSATTFIQITFSGTDTADYDWGCARCELLGDSITLDKGAILPLNQSERLLQKAGISASGDISAKVSYGSPLKEFEIEFERLLKPDYDRLYGFLNNLDVGINTFPFNFTFDGNTYFVKIIDTRTQLGADAYYQSYIALTLKELPY